MKTSEFNYELPPELIAQAPAAERAASRMLVLHRDDGRMEHKVFSDLPGFLRRGDLLVLNRTRVIPARVFGKRLDTGGKVELLLLEELPEGKWLSLCRTRADVRDGLRLLLGAAEIPAEVVKVCEFGKVEVRFRDNRPVLEILDLIGLPPLPPYIKRPGGKMAVGDKERYQTVYASEPGSVAAPTAGLHFTEDVFRSLDAAGVRRGYVTLHVGLGTFRPVKCENVEEHVMESERYELPAETAALIDETKRTGGRVIAVGSTSVRVLETVAAEQGGIRAASGRSSLFIRPPYEFRIIDGILTNFHLPMSTLLMMVCAFAGKDLVLKAYVEAISRKYRFYSYGDCMLIPPV